eukprot:EST46038.1 hypothetical protein SS50377_14026 [Spironucleus salmonicida]
MHTNFDKPVSVTVLKKQFPSANKTQEELISMIMQLQDVDLMQQNISKIDGLDMCSELVTASLQCNNIYEISVITLELLPLLKSLNLAQNKILSLPDISMTNIEDLNLAFNPIFIDPAYLPKLLKRISISGVDIERRLISAAFPQVVFYDTTEALFTQVNEVERELSLAGADPATDEEVVKTRGKMNSTKQPKVISKPPTQGSRNAVIRQVQAVSKLTKSKPATPTILSRIDQSQFQPNAYQELVDIAKKYQDALKEIDQMKLDAYKQRIEDIISQSEDRAHGSFMKIKEGIEYDMQVLSQKRVQQQSVVQKDQLTQQQIEDELDAELDQFDKDNFE